MKQYDKSDQCSIVLFNAPTKDEARRIRRHLLEKKYIRGGFIVDIEPGFLNSVGEIEEESQFYVVFAHTYGKLTQKALTEIENVSDSKGMSWDLKEGTDNYTDWVLELKKYIT